MAVFILETHNSCGTRTNVGKHFFPASVNFVYHKDGEQLMFAAQFRLRQIMCLS